jgi:hypothetical protein
MMIMNYHAAVLHIHIHIHILMNQGSGYHAGDAAVMRISVSSYRLTYSTTKLETTNFASLNRLCVYVYNVIIRRSDRTYMAITAIRRQTVILYGS